MRLFGRRPAANAGIALSTETVPTQLQSAVDYAWHFVQANSHLGKPALKATFATTIAVTIPGFSPALTPFTNQFVDYLFGGNREAATSLAEKSPFQEAVVAMARNLREDVRTVVTAGFTNKFEIDRDILKTVIDVLFDCSRRWKCDLVLQGSVIDKNDLTFVRTGQWLGSRSFERPSDLATPLTTNETLVKIFDGSSATGQASAIRDRYHAGLEEFRGRSNAYYQFDGEEVERDFLPVFWLDGSGIIVKEGDQTMSRRLSDLIIKKFGDDHFRAHYAEDRRKLLDWRLGVAALFDSLADIPALLQHSPEDTAVIVAMRDALSQGGNALTGPREVAV